jgi:outer membrane protein
MKKILFIVAIMAIGTVSVLAQTEKGKFLISGSTDLSFTSTSMTLEYDNEDQGDSDVTTFTLTPRVAYFVADNFALGLAMNVENSKQDDATSNSLLVGPTARYYVGGSTSVKPYLEASYLFGSQKEEDDTMDYEYKAKVSGWDLGGGAAIFLNEFASIDLGLTYGNATMTNKDDEKLKMKIKGLSVNVGFSLYF